MAQEIRNFAAVIPAGTAQASPVTIDMSFPTREVQEIEIRVPPGPAGKVGFSIASGGVQMIPYGVGTFIVTDNETINWPMEEQIQSGKWQLVGYNTGKFAHTIYVRFLVVAVQATQRSTAPGGGQSPADLTGTTGSNGGTSGSLSPPSVPMPSTPPPPGGSGIGIPLTLPPALPSVTGQAAPAVPELALMGVDSISQVWLLEDGLYQQLLSLSDMQALLNKGIPGIHIGQEFHNHLLDAARRGVLGIDWHSLFGGQLTTGRG